MLTVRAGLCGLLRSRLSCRSLDKQSHGYPGRYSLGHHFAIRVEDCMELPLRKALFVSNHLKKKSFDTGKQFVRLSHVWSEKNELREPWVPVAGTARGWEGGYVSLDIVVNIISIRMWHLQDCHMAKGMHLQAWSCKRKIWGNNQSEFNVLSIKINALKTVVPGRLRKSLGGTVEEWVSE